MVLTNRFIGDGGFEPPSFGQASSASVVQADAFKRAPYVTITGVISGVLLERGREAPFFRVTPVLS